MRLVAKFTCGLALCTLVMLKLFLYTRNATDIENERLETPDDPHYITQIENCPLCYGESLCSKFNTATLKTKVHPAYGVTGDSLKNVYFAEMLLDDKWEDVILKRLAHDSELMTSYSQIHNIISQDVLKHNLIEKSGEGLQGAPGFVTCPTRRLVKLAKESFTEATNPKSFTKVDEKMFLTEILINSEPIYLQMFPADDGWPFPRYYGACGRFVVQSYEGSNLGQHCHDDWKDRINYAYQLLKIAQKFTENDKGVALYWTDVSLDNFAVNSQKQVKVIDAENIFIVDTAENKAKNLKVHIQREHEECSHPCVAFESDAMCKASSSTFNYFALCEAILAPHNSCKSEEGGLLHNVPVEVMAKWNITSLISNCLSSRQGESPTTTVLTLIRNLKEILQANNLLYGV